MRTRLVPVLLLSALWSCKTTVDSAGSAVKDLSDGTNWCHQRLQSTDGTKISVDFQMWSENGIDEARPLWINVERSGLGANDSVRVVMIEKFSQNGQELEGKIEEKDLHWSANDGKFTGEVAGMILNGGGKSIVGHEFAFRINNDWLKDPVSGNSNFKANLFNLNRQNRFVCKNPSSPASPATVKNWRALPSQSEMDDLMSKPLNDPAHPYTDYRPNAPGANMDLPGEAILAAMNRNKDKFQTGRGGHGFSYMNDCLTTGYSPTHWPDIAIHYYCLMSSPRYCYTYATSGQIPRHDSFKGCIGQWNGNGSFPHQNYVPEFEWVRDDQPIEFQYVMFGQTNAFKPEQEQAIINEFWGVSDPNDVNECRQKRPRRSEDPTDGTHCQAGKAMRTPLIGRSR